MVLSEARGLGAVLSLLGGPPVVQSQSGTIALLLADLHTRVPSDVFHQRVLLLRTSLKNHQCRALKIGCEVRGLGAGAGLGTCI